MLVFWKPWAVPSGDRPRFGWGASAALAWAASSSISTAGRRDELAGPLQARGLTRPRPTTLNAPHQQDPRVPREPSGAGVLSGPASRGSRPRSSRWYRRRLTAAAPAPRRRDPRTSGRARRAPWRAVQGSDPGPTRRRSGRWGSRSSLVSVPGSGCWPSVQPLSDDVDHEQVPQALGEPVGYQHSVLWDRGRGLREGQCRPSNLLDHDRGLVVFAGELGSGGQQRVVDPRASLIAHVTAVRVQRSVSEPQRAAGDVAGAAQHDGPSLSMCISWASIARSGNRR